MKRKILSIFYSSIIIILVVCETSCMPRKNIGEFVLINNSNDSITEAKIDICKQVIKIKNMKQNEKFTGTFKIITDSHYKVVIVFASGKVLTEELGYVTHGFDLIKDTISVTDSRIVIIDTKTE